MKRDRGFSLLEMILTMSVGSVLMVLAMTVLQQAMTLSTQAREQREADAALNRLCDQFRRDVHDADTVDLSQDDAVLLMIRDEVVDYDLSSPRARRSVLGRVRMSAGKEAREPKARESYDVGASTQFSIERLESPQRVMLTVRRLSPLRHLEPRIDRQISAVVGRSNSDLRSGEVQP